MKENNDFWNMVKNSSMTIETEVTQAFNETDNAKDFKEKAIGALEQLISEAQQIIEEIKKTY